MKKILVDGRSMTSQKSGIGRYTYELAKGYIREYGEHSVTVILADEIENFPFPYILCPLNRHSFVDNVRFSFFLKRLDYDIYHAGDLIGPFFHRREAIHIVTVHDLMLLRVKNFCGLPYWHNKVRQFKFKEYWKYILCDADIIVSVSETTKKDVEQIYGIKSLLLREGINKLSCDCREQAPKKFHLTKGGYFLYVGLTLPHKNVQFLIETFLKSHTDKILVICGKGHKPVQADRVVYTGWVNDTTLDFLYRNCAAFIFPSIYEGFGLPILEALSYHCRVFSSNAASLGEFSEQVISFFSPYDESRLQYLIEHCDQIPVNDVLIDSYLRRFQWENIWSEFHQNLRYYIYERDHVFKADK